VVPLQLGLLINQRLKKRTAAVPFHTSFLLPSWPQPPHIWQIHFRAFCDVYKLPPLIRQKTHAPPTLRGPLKNLSRRRIHKKYWKYICSYTYIWNPEQCYQTTDLGAWSRRCGTHIIISGWTATRIGFGMRSKLITPQHSRSWCACASFIIIILFFFFCCYLVAN